MKNKTNWPLRPEPGSNPLVYIGRNTLDELVDVWRMPEMDPGTPLIPVILRTVREQVKADINEKL